MGDYLKGNMGLTFSSYASNKAVDVQGDTCSGTSTCSDSTAKISNIDIMKSGSIEESVAWGSSCPTLEDGDCALVEGCNTCKHSWLESDPRMEMSA